MSTAYGPRLQGLAGEGADLSTSDETVVAEFDAVDSTNVQTRVAVWGIVAITADGDATGVEIAAYLGPFTDGAGFGAQTYTFTDPIVAGTPLAFNFGTELGPDVQGSSVEITVSLIGATVGGGAVVFAQLAVF